jgi:spore coat protein U-like protein
MNAASTISASGRKLSLGALGCAAMLLWQSLPAQAQSCTVSSPTVSFGSVNMVSGTTYAPSGSQFTVSCNVNNVLISVAAAFSVCLKVAGASGSTPRSLLNGSNSLGYNLYSDATLSQIWGSNNSGNPANVPVTVVTNSCGQVSCSSISGSTSVTIYGELPSTGNTAAPAGTYTQNSSGTAPFNYTSGLLSGLLTSLTSCTSGTSNSNSAGNFTVAASATVSNFCTVSANNINFGASVGILSSAIPASAQISATCTAGDSYTIALNQGTTSGASLSNRLMAGSGSAVVQYGLYTSGSYSTVWGDGSPGTGTLGGTGTGSTQYYTVYGLVPAQTTPAPNTYSDLVTVTVSY